MLNIYNDSYLQNQNEPYMLSHDIYTNVSHSEDGFVQTFTLRTQSLTNKPSIYISIAAVNKVLVFVYHASYKLNVHDIVNY